MAVKATTTRKRARRDRSKVSTALAASIPANLIWDPSKSLAATVATLPASTVEDLLATFTDEELAALEWDWRFWGRPSQFAPDGAWFVWLVMAGRGFGKTRCGAEWVIEEVLSGRAKRVALVGRTAADVRDVMIEGESGLLACSPPWFRPIYEPSKRRLTWPNGAIATAYSGDEPALLRGPQHDLAWCDELAAWRYVGTWDNLLMGLRLGKHPRAIVTTTPRPTPLIKELAKDPNNVVTKGRTTDNAANLAANFLREVERKYSGTRLGRQELDGEILEDVAGALWKRDAMIEAYRVHTGLPAFVRVVVGVDPATTSNEESAETGIVVAALGEDGHVYVLDDLTVQDTPTKWASAAVAGYHKHHADRIVGEVNNGGDLVEHTIRTVDAAVSYKAVRATRGKALRAEPVSALYEQGKVHHLGAFPTLEDQLCSWVPGDKSPDRLDALVWAITELAVDPEEPEATPRVRRL